MRRRGSLLERLAEGLRVEVPAGLLDGVEVDLLEADADAAHVGQVAGADHLGDPALVDDLLPYLAEQLAVASAAGWRSRRGSAARAPGARGSAGRTRALA